MSSNSQHVCPSCQAINRILAGKQAAGPKCGKCKQPLFTGVPIEVNQAQFERFLHKDDAPILVDFWAPWCGPCKMMAPAFAQAAVDLGPSVRLLKVNTEEQQGLGARFNIRSIPTLALFRGGKEVARQPGAIDARSIVQWVRTSQSA